ncbi:PrsW family intramembrane metalloprotease [Corynebacterium glutamicum]|uniref:PrsW family intramembrane metalloprotease n=1 Tax=Corynebacterium glutamicum TaxID=1718 RepID=UPI00071F75BF|nr:PrsW family intramembrane metalloprotease [Corynebacterium glutamicum]ALP48913.1 hypothetical protein AC079_00950 [Corynebacterium glutamicum]
MSRMFSITLWVAILLSTPALFLSLATFLFVDGISVLVNFVFAVLYLVVIVFLLSRTPLWPRFKGSGSKKGGGFAWAASSLLWGAFVGFGIVMLFAGPVMDLTDKLGWDFVAMSFTGAYPEEIAKALGVAIILLSFRQLNRPWHGFITGALVGLGFEVNENLLYGATGAIMDPNADLDGVLMMWQYRTMLGPLIHTLLTGFAGYGIALAFFRARKTVAWRWSVAIGWTLIAFALHFSWNLMWENVIGSYATIIVVSVVMYGLAIYIIWSNWAEARDDSSYAFVPGIITNTKDLSLLDAPIPVGTEVPEPRIPQQIEEPKAEN